MSPCALARVVDSCHLEDVRRFTRPVAVCVVGLLAATACGDGGHDSPVVTTSVPAPSPDRQAVLDEFRSTFGSPGAVVALRASGTHWIGVAGVADLAGARLTDTSRFRIGSISKTISSVRTRHLPRLSHLRHHISSIAARKQTTWPRSISAARTEAL